MLPFSERTPEDEVVLFTDVDGDGLAEALLRLGSISSSLKRGGEEVSGMDIPYCDCDC